MRTLLFVLLVLALPAMAVEQKTYRLNVRFHPEDASDTTGTFCMPVEVPGMADPVFVRKLPTVSERDIISMKTFNAPDGSYGAYFNLTPHGKFMLETETALYKGKLMVAVINNVPVTAMYIDRQINDGIIGIPNGLSIEQVEKMEKDFKTKKKKE